MKLSQALHGHRIILAIFFFFILLADSSPPSSATPRETALPHFTSDPKEVSDKLFDYIIVGGGTAGCPLAATLSQKFSVLLIERGDSPYKNPIILDKIHFGFLLLETYDDLSSVVQPFVSEEGVLNHRGRVLGGSSAINGGFYSRASEGFVRESGWDENMVREAYEWVESRVVFEPQVLTQWQSVVKRGFVEAGILPYNGYELEHVLGTKIGATIFDDWGGRHSSADLLAAGNPANLMILLNATVKDLIVRGDYADQKRAHGIRFITSDITSKQTYKAYLKPKSSGDIILCAGALGSPQILMLSGIGSFNHLKSFNLPLVVDLNEVGHHMKDNPSLTVLVDSKPQKRQPETPQVAGIADDFRIIIEAGINPISLNQTRVGIAGKIAFTLSEGKLELNNTDPRKNPSVSFNYLAREEDLEGCVRLVELLKRAERSESVAMFLGTKRKTNDLMMSSEEEMRKFCRKNVTTFYHYHGGCVMGSVVDKDYKVFGVKGLRVVDGSTFLESPGTNPMATLLMLGRYQGMKILNERNAT